MTHARFPDFSARAPAYRARAIAVSQPTPSPAVLAAARALDRTGEVLAAVLIVAGGAALVGLATLV